MSDVHYSSTFTTLLPQKTHSSNQNPDLSSPPPPHHLQRDRRTDGSQSQAQRRRRVLPRLASQGDLALIINLIPGPSANPLQKYLPEELMPPPGPPPGPPGPPGPPPPPGDEVPDAPARPGWRTVVKRPEPRARRKGKAAAAAATPPPPPPPAIEAPRPELPSWAQWRRKHAIHF